MEKESEEIIRQHYDNAEGEKVLQKLLLKTKDKKDLKLLDLTGLDKKIKLK